MPSQLPPRPEGHTTGFPYSILWEEFAQIWERLEERSGLEEAYEALLAKAVPLKLCLTTEPSRAAIKQTIQPLKLSSPAADELEARLYRIAAAYRIPHLKIELGIGAAASKAHLAKLSAAAARFAKLLASTPVEQEVVLGLVRGHVDPDAERPPFNFKDLLREASNLSGAATMMAEEIPQLPRGTSVDVLQARLMEAATRAIGLSAADELKVLQADGAGRNPRPKSTSARVLFAYLNLVDPGMTDTAKVRLFAGHNYGPKSVSIEELKAHPPKSWPLHDSRKKLTR